jgi:hypothetical protein
LDVSTLPVVLGATNNGAEVPLPRITLLAVSVVAPVPPLAIGRTPVTCDVRLILVAIAAVSCHPEPLYILVLLLAVLKYIAPVTRGLPSLSTVGSDALAPKNLSSNRSKLLAALVADAAEFVADVLAADSLAAAAIAEAEALDACVVAVLALVDAKPAWVVAVEALAAAAT